MFARSLATNNIPVIFILVTLEQCSLQSSQKLIEWIIKAGYQPNDYAIIILKQFKLVVTHLEVRSVSPTLPSLLPAQSQYKKSSLLSRPNKEKHSLNI